MIAPRLAFLLTGCAITALMLSAETGQPGVRTDDTLLRENPTYSVARLKHQEPEDLLTEWEAKLAVDPASDHSVNERFFALPLAAKFALEAGQNDKAKTYAEEALNLLDTHPKLPRHDVGTALFYCNLVLGRLALIDGDISRAEDYLLRSGLTPGSSVLDSFGPNMSLARELLKRSRSETVLKFFEECRAFWIPACEHGQLTQWSEEVKAGQMPAFGPNLFH